MGLLIGVGLVAFGVYIYFDLAVWENSTAEMRMNSMMWVLYDFGGKTLVAASFGLIGIVSAVSGYKKSQDLNQIIKDAEAN